jgi:hypothetical protein
MNFNRKNRTVFAPLMSIQNEGDSRLDFRPLGLRALQIKIALYIGHRHSKKFFF